MLRDHRRVSTGARWLRHREACAPVVGRAGARGVDQAAAPIGLRGVVGRAYALHVPEHHSDPHEREVEAEEN